MALQKQNFTLNFAQGLDTKTDPFQLEFGRFVTLNNIVFDTGKLLQKRNGYQALTVLPDTTSTYLTTFNGNLTALGNKLEAYASGTESWVNKGNIQPVSLSVLPLVRTNTYQSFVDTAIANGVVCTVYTDNPPSGTTYNYVIADATTGQNIVAPTAIPLVSGAIVGSPRVFALSTHFIIVFSNLISATNHLQYIAISTQNPTSVTTAADLSTLYTPSTTVNFDGVVANNVLYLAWNGSDTSIRLTYLTNNLSQGTTKVFSTYACTLMSVCADTTQSTPVIWAAFYNTSGTTGYVLAVNSSLTQVLAPTQIISSGTVKNITATATTGQVNVFYEVSNAYTYDSSIPTNYIRQYVVTQLGGSGTQSIVARSVGLASKAFLIGTDSYFLSTYSSTYQPSYFLMKIVGASANVIGKLAYSNGGGYLATGLPSVAVSGTQAQVGYLYQDQVQAANKAQGTSAAPVFAQLGVNLATFTLTTTNLVTSEIANNLHISGGFLWAYDGVTPVEQNFHLWPDSLEVTSATTGGFLTAQIYFYIATYEWQDNQGNLYRSAPSIAVQMDIHSSGTATNKNTINVPTLRLTYKTANPVKIVLYRWSTAQQTYYQVTSINSPKLNDTTVDYVTIQDTLADSSIVGNNILYTAGGVVEDIGPPATKGMTLYRSRLVLIDAEDPNLLWFSKQVIEATPVEMSDLFTIYVAPTISAQGNTGPITCVSSLDDKLIIFKKNAIYYMVFEGPDNTGANSDIGDPIFVTSTVGCTNPSSIVFMPQGLMFQSDKGIWLLGRDLSTTYIGSPIEFYNDQTITSALTIPGTNQVRFTLSSGTSLVYDYFYGQWFTFSNVPAVSSTLYQSVQTYMNKYGQVLQETPGVYLDNATPVVMNFTTGWLNLAGMQGYQRAYWFYLLANYLSPHKLQVQVAYDYNPSPTQTNLITPDNYAGTYGSDTIYGGASRYGGSSEKEQWRVFLQQQKCQAFQISLQEVFDPSYGTSAGAGLTLSGIDLVVGAKSGYPRLKAGHSVG